MAGAGKKTFVAGDVLTASDVNSYLMDQAVMRFATASARSAALPTPSEGMMAYLDSTNQVEVYDGAAWGSVSASLPSGLPFAMSATTASLGGQNKSNSDSISSAGTVNWPVGRFTVAPIVTVTNADISVAGSYKIIYTSGGVTASTATIYYTQSNLSGSVTDLRYNLMAVQMTSGSAAG
jgi:hypothetical protein